ncbi:MAG TPA: DAK2 domain-containing protein [Acidimicrobiia bacterium]|nr:DAK2 domain-containing protein [Acidimicrobiia bacterium]
MGVLQTLAPSDLRRVVSTYRDVLRRHQDELNRLNVYPVPDGDTGTNMALTLESVVDELPDDGSAMPEVCEAIRHGSLMGARGNSGVILSQILRGLADTFSPLEAVSAHDVIAGLRRAADAAYQAVLRPVEGTILTVVRLAAEAVEHGFVSGEASLADVLDRAAAAAHDAVARTPDLLPVLRDAGVVDAGGRGFELLLAACLSVVAERPVPEPEAVATPPAVAAHLHHEVDVGELRYEVMYLLHAADATIPQFKRAWGELGDSIVVVGGDGLWNCHVHTNDIGAAIEAGIAAGRPATIRVTDLHEQVEQLEEEAWVRDQSAPPPIEPVATGVVAVAVGDGLRRLLHSLGVQHVVAGGQSMNPSTAQILEAVHACEAESVIVLPNNKNIVPVARQVPDLADRPVSVVPTTAVVEALSALVAYDAAAPLAENIAAMDEAAGRVRAGEVTRAVRDSVAECGPISAGDWIAITRDGVCVSEKSPADATIALVDRLIDDDAELVTIVVGVEADAADTARITEHLELAHPDVEVEVHEGDQPLYPYLVGVE